MDQNTNGKLLPNLKITLGNDLDSDDQIEEGEIPESEDCTEKSSPDEEEKKKSVEIVRNWMNTLQSPKVYENKDGGFITGLDLSSEVLLKKLEDRAERFGIEKKQGPITQEEINRLYKSLDIDPENLNSCKLKNIRLDALHMRGVDDMSTSEIFCYFRDYGPSSVEWINDFSCNVLWLDDSTTARAMIGMSRPFVVKKKIQKKESQESLNYEADSSSSENEAVIEMSESEDSNDANRKDIEGLFMEVDAPDSGKSPKVEMTIDSSEVDPETLNVPVPPGYWRVGVPHPKAKAILLRFATKDDRKLPGAEKRSQYYQKYGNPNYGGLRGLISSSRKRKIQAARNRQMVEKLNDDSSSQLDIHQILSSGEIGNRPAVKANRIKMPRMRMYADDEEKRQKKRAIINQNFNPRPLSVHSRLGIKYSRDDLYHLGNKFSSDSEVEEEDDNVAINCTVPSRYKIWTDIAKSMAEEDRNKPLSRSPPDYNPFEFRNGDVKSSRGSPSFQDSRSIEDTRYWRPSSNRPSSDLRSTLSSYGKGISPLLRSDEEDLRSRIKRIKKDDSVNKHRSPLLRDD